MPLNKQKQGKHGVTLESPQTLKLKHSSNDTSSSNQSKKSLHDSSLHASARHSMRSSYDSGLTPATSPHSSRVSSADHTHTTSSTPTKKKGKTKEDVVAAIIASEREYVETLDRLIKGVVRPLSDSSAAAKYRQVLFSNVKDIYSTHVAIQTDMEFEGKQQIGDVVKTFIHNRDELDVHSEYNYNLPKALSKLEELKSSEPQVYKKITSGETPTFRIKELLSSVPTIIDTHIHHLEELLKLIGEKGKEKHEVTEAIQCLKDISEHITQKIAGLEMQNFLVHLQSQISGVNWNKSPALSKHYGKLIFDETLLLRKKESDPERSKHGFLFDRILLITKPAAGKKDTYEYEQAFDLAKVTLTEETRYHRIRVEKQDGSATLLSGENKSKHAKWLEKLRETRDRLLPKVDNDDDNHIFQLHTFPELTQCDVCNKLLWGVYSQGYICLKTGLRVHQKCLQQAEMLPSSRGQGRHTQDVTLSLPQRLVSEDEERKQCFGGFFGQIDLLHQVKEAGKVRTNEENRSLLVYAVEDKLRLLKAGALDGGFRYTNLDLQLANPTKPRCFIMWQSGSEGTIEKDHPKSGFVECLYKALLSLKEEIVFPTIQKVCREYQGQVSTYTDNETGEQFLAGYYYEKTEVDSSDDERDLITNKIPFDFSSHTLTSNDSRHTASITKTAANTKSQHHAKQSQVLRNAADRGSTHVYMTSNIYQSSRQGSSITPERKSSLDVASAYTSKLQTASTRTQAKSSRRIPLNSEQNVGATRPRQTSKSVK